MSTTQIQPNGAAPSPGPRAAARGPRLSVVRILVAVVVVAAVVAGSAQLVRGALAPDPPRATTFFAPYVDVTLPPYLDFQDSSANPADEVVLGFVVASPDDACTPTWGASYGLDEAATELDLDRRLVRLRQRGGDAIVSFGGVANDELALGCTDPAALAAAYASVVDRYDLTTVDLDIEGTNLSDTAATERRAEAIASVQSDRRAAGLDLSVWVTLPMDASGLTDEGVAVVDAMLAADVDLAGVNVMAMEFGSSLPAGGDVVDVSLAGLDATAPQVVAAYGRAGAPLTDADAYGKLGVTPMIGQAAAPGEVLDLEGAERLHDGSIRRGVSRFSMWSLNRDVQCAGTVDPAISNNSCSGVEQDPFAFSAIFAATGSDSGLAGDDAAAPTGTAGARSSASDEVATGPYDEWREKREYETGAKVVWRGQVYEARWWNVGTAPDAKVGAEWDSPWLVLGPVLATDVRPTPPTLAPGTYPDWAPDVAFEPGDRVLVDGVGYRAKWWTRGEDPTADVDNAWDTPWEPLDEQA